MSQFLSILLLFLYTTIAAATGGKWDLLNSNIGITAMHMQLLPNDRVLIFDRTDFGASNLSLPDGKCRQDDNDIVLKKDCTAHSIEYDIRSNRVRPLMVLTDVWCSSGSLTADGSVVQTGGFNDGDHVVRVFKSCSTCDWNEIKNGLNQKRWYATNHLLPSGRQIIIGGRRQFNYEFYPKMTGSEKAYSLPFLVQTNDPNIENNLYPFVFLNTDGMLFIFANNRAILFDYSKNKVLRMFPQIPGGDPRSYPSTGSAVLLPLRLAQGDKIEVEVLVCGGAPKTAFLNAQKKIFDEALDTCGRIKISDPNPKWAMEKMPSARCMGDMLLLPTGEVLIINGVGSGSAGWEYGRNPVLSPVLYTPDKDGDRFKTLTASKIPRVYHSTAILVRDGRVLVGGSNPHIYYNFTNVLYPTELRLEAFSPPYLDPKLVRPKISTADSTTKFGYGDQLTINFYQFGHVDTSAVCVTMVSPSFNTHSFSMNQRLLILDGVVTTKAIAKAKYQVVVAAPANANIAPGKHYILFVVHQRIPSEGVWVQIG
ncbi:aldehyde oxidase GLOX1-like [Rutidosis leptorrhynchoides]|uniref:aldehyde oxidase GLOX1-like n=1 Tax=Rutidosis leptorrhynchoides TaxID=125765 RepID=UPI003A9A3092